nr:VCBS repeat-containing protein [Catalinimonas alkaloidigena]
MKLYSSSFRALALVSLFAACQSETPQESHTSDRPAPAESAPPPRFTLLPASETGVQFNNPLTEGPNTNVMMYEYFYNGGGVAVGDLNGDGRDDLYFSANMTENRLYLNQGNFKFEDVTAAAGVATRNGPWKTGTTLADVNGDGWLDIYVCYSGNLRPERRRNELYINQGPDSSGVPHFTEQAAAYGLDSPATSTQALFFDYDRDGDLDLFLLNHHPHPLPILNERSTAELLRQVDTQSGSRLFRNEGPDTQTGVARFQDVTERAGLRSSSLSYGLGAAVADLNQDGWPDLYLSNDYAVPDYLYLNNGDGTFTDRLQESVDYTSQFSMGNEVVDVNNDARPDIYTLDMLPEDNRRQKLLFAPDNYEKFELNVRVGFHYQYMRNMLQLNEGNGTSGRPTFTEIGQIAGLSNTDWSWAPLFADFDNDGWKDLYVTNGYLHDYTNMDFVKFMDSFVQKKGGRILREDVVELVQQMPASNVTNYLFRNEGGLKFTSVGAPWGLNQPSNSNGAAYADLDGDGDLDLVINNINLPAFIYRNDTDRQQPRHFLKVQLKGAGRNTQGIGAKVMAYTGANTQYLEQMPTRGFQSSVSPILHFGLGDATTLDSLRIVWPTGKQQLLRKVAADQILTVDENDASGNYRPALAPRPLYREVKSPVAFTHADAAVNDFKRQSLLINPLSYVGPCMAKGDVNGDGRDDLFIGGGNGQSGALYLQQADSRFTPKAVAAFATDQGSDDADALFFDANNDGAIDLYVSSGGYDRYQPDDPLLQDRLYLNDGKGNFTKSAGLPKMLTSTGTVCATDVNRDGHLDLFVGGRCIPGRYPEAPESYLLINDGQGHFTDQTATLAPALQNLGLVTDAAWHDLNGDQQPELIVVGEWLPISVWEQKDGTFSDQTSRYFAQAYQGWWNTLCVQDLNGDGKAELVVGNQGLNTQVRASDAEPAELYYKDFDDNGSVDPILTFYIQGKSYPYVSRDEMLDQVVRLRSRFPNYKSYADATLQDIFTEEELAGAQHAEANVLETAYFSQNANGIFELGSLPEEAQYAPVHTIATFDYNGDGHLDLWLGGNVHHARLRLGNAGANHGILLESDGKGHFTYVPQQRSGFHLTGDVRSITVWDDLVLFGMNQQQVVAYRRTQESVF